MILRLFFIIAIYAACMPINPSTANELKAYTNVALIDSPYNDGDSFKIRINNSNVTIRIYFADCPETSVSQNTDARRVRSQTRYFGMPSHRETVFYGREAAKFTKNNYQNHLLYIPHLPLLLDALRAGAVSALSKLSMVNI